MRKVFIILSALNILVGCSRDQKEEPAVKEKEGWKLVWEDDFNRDDIFSTGMVENMGLPYFDRRLVQDDES